MTWSKCVAFGEQEAAWFLFGPKPKRDGFFWHYSGMPEAFLNEADRLACGVNQVALGPNGEWCAIFADRDRSTIFGNTSDEFAESVNATRDTAGRMQVSWVAFGPQQSFFVQPVKGEPFWHGLPPDLEDLVTKYPLHIKHLALGRPTGWCVLLNNNAWKWSLPSHPVLSACLQSDVKALRYISFGNAGDYFIETEHEQCYWQAGSSLAQVLSYYYNRSSRKEKVKSVLTDSSTLQSTHTGLMLIFEKVLEEHYEDSYFNQLMEKIKSQLLFDPQFTRVYSFNPAYYGERGGHPYFKPCGWRRCSLAIDKFEQYSDWCIAYHGTSCWNVASIMLRGLRRPGDEGVSVAHGQAYSRSGCSIYVSPSIEYAAHPVYAEFFEIQHDHWAQLVLECRVRPSSFIVKPGSLGSNHWPAHLRMDQNFETNSKLEWLLDCPEDVVFTGLMIREFGKLASEEIYGSLVRQVARRGQGPQFEWTKLRSAEYERLQHYV
ncbi:osm1 [Symbiodinium sp. CCMP2592]|nr:osm1 [Symbiodinium sp. CCMP2592]